jgi:hypothetical protein
MSQLPGLLAAFGVAVFVEIGLRVTTLSRLARILRVPLATGQQASATAPQPGGNPAALPAWARRRIRATRWMLHRWPFGDTCLRQALVSGQRVRELNPLLHVGVTKLDGEVRAHAWLVVSGVVVDPMRAASSYLSLVAPTAEPPG